MLANSAPAPNTAGSSKQGLTQPIDRRVWQVSLDPGEREAVALAIELKAAWLLLDDLPARRFAEELGLPVVGTAGVLLIAKGLGLLPELRPSLDELRATGFRIGADVVSDVLRRAGETD